MSSWKSTEGASSGLKIDAHEFRSGPQARSRFNLIACYFECMRRCIKCIDSAPLTNTFLFPLFSSTYLCNNIRRSPQTLRKIVLTIFIQKPPHQSNIKSGSTLDTLDRQVAINNWPYVYTRVFFVQSACAHIVYMRKSKEPYRDINENSLYINCVYELDVCLFTIPLITVCMGTYDRIKSSFPPFFFDGI